MKFTATLELAGSHAAASRPCAGNRRTRDVEEAVVVVTLNPFVYRTTVGVMVGGR